MDLKWFESKVGNKYLNEAAGLAAEKKAASKEANKKVCFLLCQAVFATFSLKSTMQIVSD